MDKRLRQGCLNVRKKNNQMRRLLPLPSENFSLTLLPFRDSIEPRLCKGINDEREKREIVFRRGEGEEKQNYL